MIMQHYQWSGEEEMDAICTVNLVKLLHKLDAIKLNALNFHQMWNDEILMSLAWPDRTELMPVLERHPGLSKRHLESK